MHDNNTTGNEALKGNFYSPSKDSSQICTKQLFFKWIPITERTVHKTKHLIDCYES